MRRAGKAPRTPVATDVSPGQPKPFEEVWLGRGTGQMKVNGQGLEAGL